MSVVALGHNNPPSPIEFGQETMVALSNWMAEHPVIETEDGAREAKLLLDRAKNSAGEIEEERVRQVQPLNDEVAGINARYKAIHNTDSKKPGTLDKVINELKKRLTAFIQAEEDKRIAAAEAARREAAEAERIAREAEQREREAIDNAAKGELGVDVTAVVLEADKQFSEFEKASRFADRAERDAHVKIGGGFGRSASLRTVETLEVHDPIEAITAIGLANEKITIAILSAARDYRNEHGSLPAGVSAITQRKL